LYTRDGVRVLFNQATLPRVVGHLHDDVILLPLPESFRVLLSFANEDFFYLTSLGLPNLNLKEKTKWVLVAVVK